MQGVFFGQQGTSVTNQFTPSPAIWGSPGFNIDKLLQDPSLGIHFYDNFVDYPLIGTQTTQIGHGKYKVYNTGAGVVSRVSAINSVEAMGGPLEITLDTDNDSGSIAQAYPSFFLSGLSSTSGKLACEFCFTQNSIATNMAAGFFGLAEVEQWTLATAVPFNASDAITSAASAIGFRIEEDGLGVVDTVVSDRATSFTNIGDTEAGTITANTFRKYGFLYDPSRSVDCVRFFIDNVQCSTVIARSTITGYTNFDANPMGLIWAHCADSAGTSFKGDMRWWRVAQYYPGMTP